MKRTERSRLDIIMLIIFDLGRVVRNTLELPDYRVEMRKKAIGTTRLVLESSLFVMLL